MYANSHTMFKCIRIIEKLMIPVILAAFVGGYALAEGYKKYTTPQQKQKWENFLKTHHGEAGVIMTAAGIVTKSLTLLGSGIGLMLHDRDDAGKWFR